MAGELYVGFVGSPVAAGKLLSVDASAALAVPGVVGVLHGGRCARPQHVRRRRRWTSRSWPTAKLLYFGQPVAVVAAETPRRARRRLARRCKSNVSRPSRFFDLDESIRRKKFLGPLRRIARGDVDAQLAAAPHRLSGTFTQRRAGAVLSRIAGRDRLPRRAGPDGRPLVDAEPDRDSSASWPRCSASASTKSSASASGWAARFGGKETQAAIPAMMAALVAHKTGRPARVIYNKDDDMRVTGKRHPYRSEWEVGFDDDGRIRALRVAYYSNGGCSTDLSLAVMERTLLHTDNCYFLPNVELTGQVCFTNLPSNTAFRGFGGPQAMAVIENILESIAEHLGLDAFDVRMRNLYGVGERNITPYGQIVRPATTCRKSSRRSPPRSQYRKRRDEIDAVQRDVAHAGSRPGDDGREVRHLVHHEVPQPGQRAGQHLHRRHGAGLDRRARRWARAST